MRLYGPQNRSGPFADEKIALPASIRTLDLPPRCLVNILTEPPRLQGNDVIQREAVGTAMHTPSFGAVLSAGIGKVSRVWVADCPIAGEQARYVRGCVVMRWFCTTTTVSCSDNIKWGPNVPDRQSLGGWHATVWWVHYWQIEHIGSSVVVDRPQHISGPEQFFVLCVSTVIGSPPSYKCATHQWVGASPVLAS